MIEVVDKGRVALQSFTEPLNSQESLESVEAYHVKLGSNTRKRFPPPHVVPRKGATTELPTLGVAKKPA